MDEKERQDFDLEDIIREFGGAPESAEGTPEAPEDLAETRRMEPVEEAPEDMTETRRMDPVDLDATRRMDPVDLDATRRMDPADLAETRRMDPVASAVTELSGDTIRLDKLPSELTEAIEKETTGEDGEQVRTWDPSGTVRSELFSDHWEPEYEQPIGEYIPPQPIVFQPKSRLRELKKKLVAGPEKRFYELSEKGVGKLQAAIFLSLLVVLICAASTAMYAFGMVQENRMRLMVFSQFLAMLVSALLGSYQLIEGFADLGRKRVTLNTVLAFTFVACCVDGVLCLKQLRVPCCAAFSLEVTMSLWNACQKRNIEMSRMDTLRKATRLDGIAACPEYLDGSKGLVRKEGQVEDFMDHHAARSKPEKVTGIYALVAIIAGFGLGIAAGVMGGFSAGVQVAAVSLLAAVPATAFISNSRPTWILERRFHKLSTLLCGWQGVEGLSGKAVFPLTFGDLYSPDAIRLNGMKFFGDWEPDRVLAYATAVMVAEESGLAPMFTQVLHSHNGRHYDAADLCHYENGGVGATVDGEAVLLGSSGFMKDMEIEVPDSAKITGGVYVAIGGKLSGLFAVSYDKSRAVVAGLRTLTAYRKLSCVLTTHDFMLTHSFLRKRFGVKPKRFQLPEHELRAQLRERQADADAPCLVMTTSGDLASIAYGVTGARVLRSTCWLGAILHIVGGVVGLGIMTLLVVLGSFELLTPANMFLFQLVWMIPALLITEWTRSI